MKSFLILYIIAVLIFEFIFRTFETDNSCILDHVQRRLISNLIAEISLLLRSHNVNRLKLLKKKFHILWKENQIHF